MVKETTRQLPIHDSRAHPATAGAVSGLVAITPAAGFVTPMAALLTGVFATTAINPDGANGLLYGNAEQLGVQLIAVGAVAIYSAGVTWGLLKFVDVIVGLRVSPEDEIAGLDTSQHGESAYQLS